MTATAIRTIAKPRSGNVVPAAAPLSADWVASSSELSRDLLVSLVRLLLLVGVSVRAASNFFGCCTFSQQPLDLHGVIRQRGCQIDNHVEQFVIAHRGNNQLGANRFFLQR